MDGWIARVYLDNCCLMRLFDDQSLPAVRMETQAVGVVLARIRAGLLHWVAGDILEMEIMACPVENRRRKVLSILVHAAHYVRYTDTMDAMTDRLHKNGFSWMDAAHVASAESSGCDWFLTTDQSLEKRFARVAYQFRLKVLNPAKFVLEATP